MNNLDGQLLYDLTLKSSFTLRDAEPSPFQFVVNGWVEKLVHLAKTNLPLIGSSDPLPESSLPVSCHVWEIGQGKHAIVVVTKSEGIAFSEENGFAEAVWKFELNFENDPSTGCAFFLVPIPDSAGSAFLVDSLSHECYHLDYNLKRCRELTLDFVTSGKIVGLWNLPASFANDKALLVLYSFADWNVFSYSKMRTMFSGKIENCPMLTSAAFIPKYWLIIGGYAHSDTNLRDCEIGESGQSICFVTYRLTSSLPYITTDKSLDNPVKSGFVSRLSFFRKNQPSAPIAISVSPSQSEMLVLHESGLISIWAIPSVKLKQVFLPDSQRNFSEEFPGSCVTEKRAVSQCLWWSDEHVALLFKDGAFIVCRANDCHSVIGGNAEWFEPSSVMTVIPEDVSFIIQKQPKIANAENDAVQNISDNSRQMLEVQTNGFVAILKKLLGLINAETSSVSLTNEERISSTLELWSFQRVTAEQLFEIKLENEEYGDALILAKAFNFDPDLIHLRRWKKENVSRHSIEDFLSKIVNKRTAINECISRVAESLDGERELLDFGVSLTNPAQCFDESDEDGDQDDFMQRFIGRIGEDIVDTLDSLKTNQTEIILWHLRILEYVKRLDIYETLLSRNSDIQYDAEVFGHIRERDIFELAVEAARSGDIVLTETILGYYQRQLEPFRLLILSNFPETLSPEKYLQLLPGHPLKRIENEHDCILNSKLAQQLLHGQMDYFPVIVESSLLLEMPQLKPFMPTRNADGSFSVEFQPDTLTRWFVQRAEEIENDCWSFENALMLLGFGKDAGVLGLDELYTDLKTLSLLVYSCGLKTFSLSALRTSQPLDILKFLLANSRKIQVSSQLLEKHIKIWFQPYADLLEMKCGSRVQLETTIVKFLSDSVKNDPDFVITVLKLCCRRECRLLTEPASLLDASIEALYGNNDPDNISIFEPIIASLPPRRQTDDLVILKKHNEIDRIKVLMEDSKVLAKYGLPFTIAELKDITESVDKSRDLLNRTMIHILKTASKDRSSNFFWNCVLADGLKLVDSFTSKEVSKDDWLIIYARHLLMFNGSTNSGVGRLGKVLEIGGLANMAKIVLTFSQAQASERQQGAACLSYAKSARLAVSVARELFESASDLEDSVLERAQACLDLIPEQYVQIDDELGMAFKLMQRYLECCSLMRQLEAPIVPLSIKVSGDRLGLLSNVISASPDLCIKHDQSFLRLAEILDVADSSTESRNLGMKLLANSAIATGNIEAALGYCNKIVTAKFALAWQECAQLCEICVVGDGINPFSKPDCLFPLLAFSLTHCDSPNRMRSLVAIRQRIVADNCTNLLQPPAEELAGKVVNTVVTKMAKEIGGRTPASLKQATALFSDQFRPVVSLLSEQRKKFEKNFKGRSHKGNDESFPDREMPRLDSFANHDVALIKRYISSFESSGNTQILMLRLACISSNERPVDADGSELERQVAKIGKELAFEYLSSDLFFAIVDCLSIALSSGQLNIFIEILDALSPDPWPPSDPKLAVLCVYLIALFVEFTFGEVQDSNSIIQTSPLTLIAKVYGRLGGDHVDADFVEKTGLLGERFLGIIEMLFKLDESQSISKQLPPGINVDSFFADEAYRRHAIYTMANENLEQALEFGERYNVPADDIRLKFVQHFIERGQIADDHVSEVALALRPLLDKENGLSKKRALDMLGNEIFQKLPGSEHRRLEFFFKIVEILDVPELIAALPKNGNLIIRLLVENEECFRSLDFHSITQGPCTDKMWKLLESVTDDSSVSSIVKLVELLPKVSLNASKIYRQWSVKKFLMAITQLLPIDANTIVNAVGSIEEYFFHLTPKDFAAFMFDIYSSDPFVTQKVASAAKQALLKRLLQSLKAAKAKQAKERPGASPPNYAPAQDAFRLLARHMDRVNSAPWLQFELVVDSSIYSEIRVDFDRTLSREPAISSFVANWLARLPMSGSGLGPEIVELLLNCVDYEQKKALGAYSHCFKHQLTSNADPTPLVLAVSRFSKIPGKSSLVTEIFAAFREIVFSVVIHGQGVDSSLTPSQRLQLLHRILEASGGQLNLSRAMLMDLDFLYLQINACLHDKNVNIQVDRDELENEITRAEMLKRLQADLPWQALVEFVKILPPFNDLQVQQEIIIPLLKQSGQAAASSADKSIEMSDFACLIRELFTDKRINASQLQDIASAVASLGFPQNAVVICLVSSLARDSPIFFELMGNIEPTTMNMRHPVLCSELLDAGMLPKFAQTPYFVPLVDYAINNQATSTFSLAQLIDQLAGFGMEEEIDFLRKRASARGRFVAGTEHGEADDAGSGLLGSVSGALRKWF